MLIMYVLLIIIILVAPMLAQTCQVSRNFRESPEMTPDLQVSWKCPQISRNLGNLRDFIFQQEIVISGVSNQKCVSLYP